MPQQSPLIQQLSLPGFCGLAAAVENLANAGDDERGAIFTRREVVEFILDLVGYTEDTALHEQRLLEPSFGGGDFLLVAVQRLLNSYERTGKKNTVADLLPAVRAVELHHDTYDGTAKKLHALLVQNGLNAVDAHKLCDAWLVQDDFLLTDLGDKFTHVVGNPPYIRQENIPQVLIDEYRKRYSTIYDRADLYVPFIERSLRLLELGGALSFICADRWMKNRYGGPLRQLVSEQFHLRSYVDMVDTPAFTSDVIAYPAIFVIGNEKGKITRLAHRPNIDARHLTELARAMTGQKATPVTVKEVGVVTDGKEPWLLESFEHLAVVRQLESRFPVIEETGCKVGIGVATGADEAFIGLLDELDVEEDRKLPLVTTRDILTGTIKWRGLGVINPFAKDGRLVRLENYPRLKHYLEARKEKVVGRHVAQKSPLNWYRTIDRIYPELVGRPKLLIPDIKGEAHIVYDVGTYYPHHNLYYVTSDTWDLHALQVVLLSGIARLFVAAYSTKMRGGYLRFQAQYLRRIRLPHWSSVPRNVQETLIEAGRGGGRASCNAAIAELYGIEEDEQPILCGEHKTA